MGGLLKQLPGVSKDFSFLAFSFLVALESWALLSCDHAHPPCRLGRGGGGVPWPCPCQTPGLCQAWPGPAQLFLPGWANYFLNFLSSSISIFTLILWGCYFN